MNRPDRPVIFVRSCVYVALTATEAQKAVARAIADDEGKMLVRVNRGFIERLAAQEARNG